MNQQFLEDKAGTIRMSAYSGNVLTVPTSANITLLKPDRSTLVANTAATVGGDGEMTYALTATETATRDLNYIAEWDYVVSGTTFYETQLWDVVRSKLSIPITDNDLFNELSSLRDIHDQLTGTATSATASTLVDTSELKHGNDYWNGGEIEILSGTGAEQVRPITDFVQSSSTISVSPNWVTTPDSTSIYRVVKSFSSTIEQAFEHFEYMLRGKGKRHHLILESSQIRTPMIYLAIHMIALDNRKEELDRWDLYARDYGEKYEKSITMMKLDYDKDDSGSIDEEEELTNPFEMRISRA